MSPGQTEVKQGKFVEFISRAKGYLSGANVLLTFQYPDISHTPSPGDTGTVRALNHDGHEYSCH